MFLFISRFKLDLKSPILNASLRLDSTVFFTDITFNQPAHIQWCEKDPFHHTPPAKVIQTSCTFDKIQRKMAEADFTHQHNQQGQWDTEADYSQPVCLQYRPLEAMILHPYYPVASTLNV